MIHDAGHKKKAGEPVKVEKPEQQAPEPTRQTPVEPKEETPAAASSWRSWGAFSVISNASKHVASITTQVSQSIIDSINIPDPEEMARLQAEEKKKLAESGEGSVNEEKSEESRFKLDDLLSGVTQISSKVVSGGLETLEGIGKKTIDILHETDPNIKNKIRNMNVSNKPNLSDLLKEAKERDDDVTSSEPRVKQVSFEHLLDEYKGLVFLEALEILSSQSKMKIELLLKPLSDKVLSDMEETIEEVKELCEFDADAFDESVTSENLEEKIAAATADLTVKLNTSEIVSHAKESKAWLEDLETTAQSSSIYDKSIHVLAKSCALSLNNFQKLAELLLSQDRRLTADEADSLTQLATIYCSLFNHQATLYTEKLTAEKSSDETKKLATNIFLEVRIYFIFYLRNNHFCCFRAPTRYRTSRRLSTYSFRFSRSAPFN